MSRFHLQVSNDIIISYGFDFMIWPPGYFINVYQKEIPSEDDEEEDNSIVTPEGEYKNIVQVGFGFGVDKREILEVIHKYVPERFYRGDHPVHSTFAKHYSMIELDQPIEQHDI